MSATDSFVAGAIIVAAGSGVRFGREDKILMPVGGQPMLCWSLKLFMSIDGFEQIVIVAAAHSLDRVTALVSEQAGDRVQVCPGGATRRESVTLGFDCLRSDLDLVAVHDAARPFATEKIVKRTMDAALMHGAAVPGLPVSDTLYTLDVDGRATGIQDRELVSAVQTPQVCRPDWLAAALALPGEYSDEGSALIAAGYPVQVIAGSADNIKITWPEDVERAERFIVGRTA